jgi:hypothetical protein
MSKVYDYNVLCQDIEDLKKQYKNKNVDGYFIRRKLSSKGWNLSQYRKVFFDVNDMINFFRETGMA